VSLFAVHGLSGSLGDLFSSKYWGPVPCNFFETAIARQPSVRSISFKYRNSEEVDELSIHVAISVGASTLVGHRRFFRAEINGFLVGYVPP
jgi:hypothetical protein